MRVELLGGVTFHVHGQVVDRLPTAKTATLLAWLAWHRRPTTREVLADLLWPEADREAGRNRLRVALAALRRHLEPPGTPAGRVLIADRTQVSLDPGAFVTDVEEFEQALEAEHKALRTEDRIRHLRHATTLYRGDFLAGYYDEWMFPERTRLADACIGAFRRLARALARQRSYQAALECACRAVAMDPYGESSRRTVMRLYARMGRPMTALRQYDDFVTLLRVELGTEPSQATTLLAERLRQAARNASSRARFLEEEESASGAAPSPPPTRSPERPTSTPSPDERPPRVGAPPRRLSTPGSLPTPFTRFFGRDGLMTELLAILGAPRTQPLVTLTGPAGIGKSRLAVEVASRLQDVFGARTWFIQMGDPGPEADLIDALAAAMNLGAVAGTLLEDQVLQALASGPALLVFDDLHPPDRGEAPLLQQLDALRREVPNLACLVTARRRLDLDGEVERSVPPLALPPTHGSTLDQVATSASVALFVDRARSVRADFAITEANAAAVRGVVARLEGIPLALELAAAWAQALTPAQLLGRLERRFDLLVSRRRSRVERHQSLRAAIQSSYEMLPLDLQDFFCRLSVFRGGCFLEASEQVLQEPASLELLERLRQYSLVRAEECEFGMRFQQLESLREFGEEQLSPHQRQKLEQAHGLYYIERAEAANALLSGVQASDWIKRLSHEHENLSAAFEWGLQAGHATRVVRATTALQRLWQSGGHLAEGVHWLHRALAVCAPSPGSLLPSEHVAALSALGCLEEYLGRHQEALQHLQRCLSLAREVEPPCCRPLTEAPLPTRAAAITLCLVAMAAGDLQVAWQAHEQRAASLRGAGDPWDLARALTDLARVALAVGRASDARQCLEESFALRRALGDRWGCADSLLERAEHDDAAAEPIPGDLGDLSDLHGLGAACLNVGSLAAEQGELPVAQILMQEALDTFRALNDGGYVALCLERLGLVAFWQRDVDKGRALLEEALACRRRLQDEPGIHRLEDLLGSQGSSSPRRS